MFFKHKNNGANARERSLWGDLISLGMVFPIAIVLGWYLGQWIGGMFGYPVPGRLIGLAWGILTGFWELFKVAKKLDKYDASNSGDSGDSDNSDKSGDAGDSPDSNSNSNSNSDFGGAS